MQTFVYFCDYLALSSSCIENIRHTTHPMNTQMKIVQPVCEEPDSTGESGQVSLARYSLSQESEVDRPTWCTAESQVTALLTRLLFC